MLTPGGLLAIILALFVMRTRAHQPEAQLIWVVFIESAALIIAYCMLVLDARYVLPLVPLLMAVAVPFVTPAQETQFVSMRSIRALAAVLLLVSTIFVQVYWASPFRTFLRDYELSCYDAAQKLRAVPSCARLVVIGGGPYPAHGVGWEAGLYASYFAKCRMVAFSSGIPDYADVQLVQQDLLTISPDTILLSRTPRQLGIREFRGGDSEVKSRLPFRNDFGPRGRRSRKTVVESWHMKTR